MAVSLQATDVCSYTSIASLLGSIGFGGCGFDGVFLVGGFISGYGFVSVFLVRVKGFGGCDFDGCGFDGCGFGCGFGFGVFGVFGFFGGYFGGSGGLAVGSGGFAVGSGGFASCLFIVTGGIFCRVFSDYGCDFFDFFLVASDNIYLVIGNSVFGSLGTS